MVRADRRLVGWNGATTEKGCVAPVATTVWVAVIVLSTVLAASVTTMVDAPVVSAAVP